MFKLALVCLFKCVIASTDIPFSEEIRQLGLKMKTHSYPTEVYQTYGASVVLYDKVKLLPPAIGVKGALFMKQGIHSKAFETQIKLNLESLPASNDILNMAGLAVWFLNNEPHFPLQSGKLFGFDMNWNGVGIFLFHYQDKVILTILENHGMDLHTEIDIFHQSALNMNSCHLDLDKNSNLILKIKAVDRKVSIRYGQKLSQMKNCLEEVQLDNLGIQTHLGFTARNSNDKDQLSNFDVNEIKINNNDAEYQSHYENGSIIDTQNVVLQYGQDILKFQKQERMRLTKNTQSYQLSSTDSREETLYKLFETVKHVNQQLKHLIGREESMHKQLKKHEQLPQLIDGFEKIPKQLNDLTHLIHTLDHQLYSFTGRLDSIVQDAMYLRNQALEVSNTQGSNSSVNYTLPKKVFDSIKKVQLELTQLAYKLKLNQETTEFKFDLGNLSPQKVEEDNDFQIDTETMLKIQKYKFKYTDAQRNNVDNINFYRWMFALMATFSIGFVWVKIRSLKSKFFI